MSRAFVVMLWLAAISSARAQEVEVEARCVAVSQVPDPTRADYPDCLTHLRLQVERVLVGALESKHVVGVFWSMRKHELSPASRIGVGARLRVKFVPFADREDRLGTIMRVDDTDDFVSPLLYATEWSELADSEPDRADARGSGAAVDSAVVDRMLAVLAAHGGDLIGTRDEFDGKAVFSHYEYLVTPRSWQPPADAASGAIGPLQAIIEFRDQLRARGVELLMAFPPRACAVFPDLATRIPYDHAKDGRVDRHFLEFLGELDAAEVRHVDFTPEFLRTRSAVFDGKSYLAYLLSDPHWAPWAAAVAARSLAARVRSTPGCAELPFDRFGSRSELQVAELPKRYFGGKRARGFERESLYDVITPDSNVLLQRGAPSAVVLLGDSFSNVHTDRNSDFPSHLAAALGMPLEVIASGGGGPTTSRQHVARRGLDPRVKLVIWQVVASRIAKPSEWKRVRFPTDR